MVAQGLFLCLNDSDPAHFRPIPLNGGNIEHIFRAVPPRLGGKLSCLDKS